MNTLDITPTPRILRTLGEIPFQTWQCVAELIDNSIDAFLSDKTAIPEEDERKIVVTWASDSVATDDRAIEVTDNACGMSIEQLQNAVRAGYSSNDPIGNLGLFGMGFNISTARLGEVTTIMTTRSGDSDWVGIKIDFQKLIDTRRFDAPIIHKAKSNPAEHGTKITISRLRHGILTELPNKENEIRQRLEAIYASLLNNQEIAIYVKGRQLRPRNHCVWSESRYVRYSDQNVSARMMIDRNLGDALFDLSRNCYLTADEAEQYYVDQQEGRDLPAHIVERGKRLTGWLGIQRYADPNDFGIDFIRNGRKILISDKSLFQYENPITGQKELQYPLELGTSVGGRIVGELHVDYLLPTYQKNDFDRSDNSWAQTVEAICGVGPFLPKSRKALGFSEQNPSPLCVLVNAFRRVDKGTKCLFAPNDVAKRYATEFRKGMRDYLDDILWWKAAQEEDQKQSTGGARATTAVNTGETPSDDISAYISGTVISPPQVIVRGNPTDDSQPSSLPVTTPQPVPSPETSKLDELIQRAISVSQLSGRNYKFGNTGSLNVRVYELSRGSIFYRGEKKPCFFQSDGIDCDFVYDPSHPLLAQYPITAKMLLLQYLSEKLKARDSLPDLVSVYAELVETTMQEAKIDRQSLQDRASSAFDLLREKLAVALRDRAADVVNCVHESAGEVEETVTNLIQSNTTLLTAFQSGIEEGYDAIDYVPPKTLYRLIERFPEDVFDGKVLQTPYITINLQDEKATLRARDESKDRALSFIKDALRVISGYSQRVQKNELARASLSVDFLLKELNA
ncbi:MULTISPECIES: ATP-binding protein [unclassified Akkermansia]|uniref:ATP-binding protein n=1 Tax=unclassified Akkermansia TaxID=2608915 RepID=UPI00079CBF97|nr:MULTISPECIES: ATP-binding protein [unclassified Akkermansia]KXT51040.1 ATPase/histidine kinase/DNA gyrase B/HSP90 domain protein [Akkermansia sp. KLE1797]KXU54128.1 ATPase/histidine kinase/DNA gyrase B/HSP90 domain protein [Akkermansia sp. KLE1798]KZA05615.1 ATPase/histidine kinase/DNA gyrase B/HSP90 domain protein [Akkermansia sp. KLE1605]